MHIQIDIIYNNQGQAKMKHLAILLVLTTLCLIHGFTIQKSAKASFHPKNDILFLSSSTSSSSLISSSRRKTTLQSFTNPSQEESVALGIREWPQQTKTQLSWVEEVKEGNTLTRYVLQGSGDVTVVSSSKTLNKSTKFQPGLLIEINGPATLNWKRSSDEGVIILTPGYEQGGLLIGVGLSFVILCGALIAGIGN